MSRLCLNYHFQPIHPSPVSRQMVEFREAIWDRLMVRIGVPARIFFEPASMPEQKLLTYDKEFSG